PRPGSTTTMHSTNSTAPKPTVRSAIFRARNITGVIITNAVTTPTTTLVCTRSWNCGTVAQLSDASQANATVAPPATIAASTTLTRGCSLNHRCRSPPSSDTPGFPSNQSQRQGRPITTAKTAVARLSPAAEV